MSFEQKDDSGALFKNDKGDNPNRPGYMGNGEAAEAQVLDPTSPEMNGTQPTLCDDLHGWYINTEIPAHYYESLLDILRDHGITLEEAA